MSAPHQPDSSPDRDFPPEEGGLTPAAAARLLASLESPDGGGAGGEHVDVADWGGPDPAAEGDEGSGGLEAGAPDTPPGYTIHGRLGAGAGGVVYLALREGSERPVALKILSRALGAGPGARRAWRELDLLSQLHLPSVPRVIDYGVHNGRMFIATEHVEGARLDVWCGARSSRGTVCAEGATDHADDDAPLHAGHPSDPSLWSHDGAVGASARLLTSDSTTQPHFSGHTTATPPPTLRAKVELLARIADAVHSLHERGVIHRDLKPSNILVDRNGDPVIIDLGIAALATDDVMQTLTADGAPLGTPAFMAPEQARGERSAISTRSDVYGLGATACLVLTGQTPHDVGTTLVDAVRRIADEDPRDPRTLDPGLPRPLAAIIAKATARDPARRYPSAADLGADLRRWLHGEPVEAHPPGACLRALRWMCKRPLLATAAASVALAAGIVGGTALATVWLYLQPHRVVVSPDKRTATVVSRLGTPLHEWHSEGTGIAFARFVDRPAEFGGGRVIVTAMGALHGAPEWNEQLAVWDARDLSAPIWFTPRRHALLQAPRGRLPPVTRRDLDPIEPASEEYRALAVPIIADIFPDSPGLEIVTVHQHAMFDPKCIRIYDLGGTVLFEAWHWGGGGGIHWMSGPRVLVVGGLNNEYEWAHLGQAGVSDRWPRVVYAIKPTRGERRKWVNPRMAMEGEEALWYQCLLPAHAAARFNVQVDKPYQTKLQPDHVELRARLNDDQAQARNLAWTLDRHGVVVDRRIEDPYRTALSNGEDLPDPGSLYLGDLPEPNPEAIEAALKALEGAAAEVAGPEGDGPAREP